MISAALAIIENEEQRNELAVFYEKQKNRFLNIALKILHNKEESEDAVQEAFSEIADKPDVFFSLSDIKRIHYLSAVVKNVSVDMLNKNRKLQTEELSDNIVYQNDENPVENALFNNISREEVIAFIDALPNAQSSVLVLSYLSGLSADEIGTALNIPVSAVYKRLYLARKAVRKFLAERR